NQLVKFMIIGDGIIKNELMELSKSLSLQNNIYFIDKIDHKEIVDYYNIFDILVYPRKYCDLSNSKGSYKIFEAMAMEKAIIVAELDSYKEIITDKETGLFCQSENIDDIVQQIKLLINNPLLRKKLGKNARNWVIKYRL